MSNIKIKKLLSAFVMLAVSATATLGGVALMNNTNSFNTPVATADSTTIDNKTSEENATKYYVGTPAEGAAQTGTSPEDPMSPNTFAGILTELEPGNIVYVLPGRHQATATWSVGRMVDSETSGNYVNGTYDDYIIFKALDPDAEEGTTLDFSSQPFASTNRGVHIYGNYYYWNGIDICGAGDNGMYIGGNYNVVENSEFYNNRDTGLQLGRNYSSNSVISSWPNYNLIRNCTSHNNYDNESYGENADGFAAKLTVGYHNVFDGCIAYRNSDDGWDLYGKADTGIIGTVYMYNCVAFENGFLEKTQAECNSQFENFDTEYAEANTNSYLTRDGDGNGFKLGGSTLEGDVYMYNCYAFNNRMHGVTDNSNPGVISLTDVTSYNNSAVIDNNSASATFGQIINYGTEHNNIDLRRDDDSYNNMTGVLSVYNGRSGYDAYKASTSNSLLAAGSRWYQIEEALDADSTSLTKRGTTVTAVAAADLFEALPAANLGLGTSELGSDLHTALRNEDGSVKFGDILKIKASSGITIGANLAGDETTEYAEVPFTFMTNNPEVTSANAAVAKAVEDMIYLPVKQDAVYQDFDLSSSFYGCSNIVWTSSDENVIEIAESGEQSVSGINHIRATVWRADEDKNVTLTATFSVGGVNYEKKFEVTVKQNEYLVGDIVVEGVDLNDTIIVDRYDLTGEPQFSVLNQADYNGKVIPESIYEGKVETTYMYSAVKGGKMVEVAGFSPSNAGVYDITHTVTLSEDNTNTYTYRIFVVDRGSSIDFVSEPQISVTYSGFAFTGELSNVSGTLYAMAADEEPSLQQLKLFGQSYAITSDTIYAEFENDNSGEYTIYYAVCNPRGKLTSDIMSKSVEVQEISTEQQFLDLVNSGGQTNVIYQLVDDLDFTGFNYTLEEVGFKALLDGQGHTISNISVSSSDDGLASVFYRLEDGSVMNLNFENITLAGAQNVGIFGSAYGGYIGNIKLNNVAVSGDQRIGGLIGRVYEQPGMDLIIDRVSLVNDDDHTIYGTGSSSRAAGIIGFMQPHGTVEAYKVNVTITNCFVDAIIGMDGKKENGGIVAVWDDGYNGNVVANLTIDKCYFVGTVIAETRAGGIVGYQKGVYTIMVTNCVSAGDIYHAGSETPIVVAEKNASGIFGGYASTATTRVVNCYAKFQEHNANYFVEVYTPDNLKSETFWSISLGFDLENVWQLDTANEPYVTLR